MINTKKPVEPQPCIPDYAGRCVTNILPTLVARPSSWPPWFPAEAQAARQVVVLVLDGLGWSQLENRSHLAPNLTKMAGGPIATVCPTTTATALTSITTGLAPGEHGLVGYRMNIQGTVLNVLRWWTDDAGDARRSIPPEETQPHDPFLGSSPSVITKAEFETSGFTRAHLRGGKWAPWHTPANLVTEVARCLAAGDSLVYAYYDGIDKVSHAYGLGEHFDAEVAFADSIVGAVKSELGPEAALVVTADHGQVHVGDQVVRLPNELDKMVDSMSGEARFRWLHTRPDRVHSLGDEARSAFGHQAWVVTKDQVIDERWFGPVVTGEALGRLGDVALVPFEPIAFDDPNDSGLMTLVGRHGSMTYDEVMVPLLVSGPPSSSG